MAAVAKFQVGQLAPGSTGAGGGEETGDPHPVVVGDAQLRTGVRAFLTQDQPGARRPGRQVDAPGELGDPGPVAELDPRTGLPGAGLAGLIRRGPRRRGQGGEGGVNVEMAQVRPEGELGSARRKVRGELVSGPRGVGTHQHLSLIHI